MDLSSGTVYQFLLMTATDPFHMTRPRDCYVPETWHGGKVVEVANSCDRLDTTIGRLKSQMSQGERSWEPDSP
jgi:hypothetical protein